MSAKPDGELTAVISAMSDRAEAQALLGRRNLEAAFNCCKLMLLEAACEDGVEVDHVQLGFEFGVVEC